MRHSPTAEEKLEAIVQGARAILQKRSFPEAARAIFDRCRQMTGAVSGYVALLSDDGTENEVLFLESGGEPCSVDTTLPMPIRGLRAEAYETHRAVFDNDFMSSRWVEFLPPGHVPMRNVMFAPLNLEGRTVGLMGLANKHSDFTEADAEIAAAFGELAAIALVNSRRLEQLDEKTASLEKALAEVRTLRGLLPMCSGCKSIRDDSGLWQRIEAYLSNNMDVRLSHGLCPDCLRELYPEEADMIRQEQEMPAD